MISPAIGATARPGPGVSSRLTAQVDADQADRETVTASAQRASNGVSIRRRASVRFRQLLGAAGTLLSLAGCGGPPPPPDVMIVCIDTLRRDHVGTYGYARETTPAIDRLAREGVRFDRARAPSNWTVPSVATLLTGLEPWRHGARIVSDPAFLDRTPPAQIVESAPSLAARLQAGGYATGLFSANPFVIGRFTRGFEVARTEWIPADQLTDLALEWWRARADRPRLLYLHYMDAHQPNEPPPPYFEMFGLTAGQRRPIAAKDWDYKTLRSPEDPAFVEFREHRIGAYDGAVRFVDDQLARLLEAVSMGGGLDRTLILVSADHGEEFWDHAEVERSWADDPRGIWGVGHGHTFFEELLAIPLVVRGPGFPKGERSECPVTLADLAPTVARAAGVVPHPAWAGLDLARLDDGRCPPRVLAAASPAYGPQGGAIWAGPFKLIERGPRRLLFDLEADPLEQRDLGASEPGRAAALARALEDRMGRGVTGEEGAPISDEQLRRQLRALGYL